MLRCTSASGRPTHYIGRGTRCCTCLQLNGVCLDVPRRQVIPHLFEEGRACSQLTPDCVGLGFEGNVVGNDCGMVTLRWVDHQTAWRCFGLSTGKHCKQPCLTWRSNWCLLLHIVWDSGLLHDDCHWPCAWFACGSISCQPMLTQCSPLHPKSSMRGRLPATRFGGYTLRPKLTRRGRRDLLHA